MNTHTQTRDEILTEDKLLVRTGQLCALRLAYLKCLAEDVYYEAGDQRPEYRGFSDPIKASQDVIEFLIDCPGSDVSGFLRHSQNRVGDLANYFFKARNHHAMLFLTQGLSETGWTLGSIALRWTPVSVLVGQDGLFETWDGTDS